MYQTRITIVLFVILLTRFSIGVITDVQLVGGPDSNKGTIEIKIDNGTWETVCGVNTDFTDVIVICRQLGFQGANRAIHQTPYGQNSTPIHRLLCDRNDTNLSECSFISLMACSNAGAASCHGEEYLGCFQDNISDRVLSGDTNFNSSMTISNCIQFCQESTTANFTYAGVENGDECYCGVASDNYTRHGMGVDSDCSIPCLGDPTESCGGSGYIAVFRISREINTSDTPPTISTWSTEEMQDISTQKKPMTNQPSSEMTSGQSTRNDLTSYFGAVVGEGVVIILLSVLLMVSVIYIIRIRNMMKDLHKDQKTQQVDLFQSSSLPEKDTGFYHDIEDVMKSDPSATSDGDVHYSSQIYEHKGANVLDPDDTSAPQYSYMI